MTLLHAKNKVAQKYGYDSWSGKVNGMLTHISNARTIEQRMDEVAILYAQMQVKNLTMHDVIKSVCDDCKTEDAVYSTNIGEYCRGCKPF